MLNQAPSLTLQNSFGGVELCIFQNLRTVAYTFNYYNGKGNRFFVKTKKKEKKISR
jgi:hypothetical protein